MLWFDPCGPDNGYYAYLCNVYTRCVFDVCYMRVEAPLLFDNKDLGAKFEYRILS